MDYGRLEYRALHPIFDGEAFSVCGNAGESQAELCTANGAGHYAMHATSYF